jgi:hypothetical protein
MIESGLAPGASTAFNHELLAHHVMYGMCAHRRTESCKRLANSMPIHRLRLDVIQAIYNSVSSDPPPLDTLSVICSSLGYCVKTASPTESTLVHFRTVRSVLSASRSNKVSLPPRKTFQARTTHNCGCPWSLTQGNSCSHSNCYF